MIRILFLSNIIYSKGIIHLLEALKALDSPGQFSLSIAGKIMSDRYMDEVKLEGQLHNLIGELRNQGYKVEFQGVAVGAVTRYYSRCDLVCLPSFYESEACPLVLMEAAKNGCAILTTDWRYLKSYSEGRLLYAKPKDVQSLKSSLSLISIHNNLVKAKESSYQWSLSFLTKQEFQNMIFKLIKGNE